MDNSFMGLAIGEAKKALAMGEVPVGAVVVRGGEVIAAGFNMRENAKNPILHAEITAIGNAARALGDWRLDDCELYVTLEPCVMCSGAILGARMKRVIFGAYDPEYGGAGGKIDLFARHCFGGATEVIGGVMEDECAALLDDFFKELRKK